MKIANFKFCDPCCQVCGDTSYKLIEIKEPRHQLERVCSDPACMDVTLQRLNKENEVEGRYHAEMAEHLDRADDLEFARCARDLDREIAARKVRYPAPASVAA
jgi:hypothetical protein